MNQLYIYACPLPLESPSHSLFHPVRSSQSRRLCLHTVASHWLSIWHSSVCKSVLLSQFVRPSPSPATCPQLCSLQICLSLFTVCLEWSIIWFHAKKKNIKALQSVLDSLSLHFGYCCHIYYIRKRYIYICCTYTLLLL